jgi:cobalt-zinc-cadmium efflux system outer membrane protein
MPTLRAFQRFVLRCVATAVIGWPGVARAADNPSVPSSTALPPRLDLETSLALFRTHGLDLIIADANVASAEGGRKIAGAVANPVVSAGVGASFGPIGSSSTPAVLAQLTDNAAIADLFVGKRRLRVEVAERALQAARLDRQDAQRVLEAQVKNQYLQAVVDKALLNVTREARDTSAATLDVMQKRYTAGAVSEADLLRVQTEKLGADDAVNAAERDLRGAKVDLAFLLGVRELVPDFDVDDTLLDRRLQTPLDALDRQQTLGEALAGRPDLASARRHADEARASVALARRTRFPDLALWASYSNQGFGTQASQPPTVMVGVSAPLPVFYQNQGEVAQAEASVRAGTATAAKVEGQVVNDVESAIVTLQTARERLARMDTSLLVSARRARDLVAAMYDKGGASLLEMLDSQRTFLATNAAHVQAAGEYWAAVFGIEQATGRELR